MRKLCTPQQYGYALEELNNLRPLQVDDKVRQVICTPTLNELADSSTKSASGRLVKGTQQGSLFPYRPDRLNSYESKNYFYNDVERVLSISFRQPVKVVLLCTTNNLSVMTFYWCSSNYLIMIKDLNAIGVYYLYLQGKTFDVYFQVPELGALEFDVYGFY